MESLPTLHLRHRLSWALWTLALSFCGLLFRGLLFSVDYPFFLDYRFCGLQFFSWITFLNGYYFNLPILDLLDSDSILKKIGGRRLDYCGQYKIALVVTIIGLYVSYLQLIGSGNY